MGLPRPCLGCGQITRSGARCTRCQAEHEATRRPSSQERYGNGWTTISQQVLRRDHHICHWCGDKATTADHLTPISHGGTNDLTNLVASCRPCNSSRGNRGGGVKSLG